MTIEADYIKDFARFLYSSRFKDLLPFSFKAIVNLKDDSYFVSCVDTLDQGIELMVFKMYNKAEEKLGKNFASREPLFELPKYEEADWSALYQTTYDSIEEASDGFDYVITNLQEVLNDKA